MAPINTNNNQGLFTDFGKLAGTPTTPFSVFGSDNAFQGVGVPQQQTVLPPLTEGFGFGGFNATDPANNFSQNFASGGNNSMPDVMGKWTKGIGTAVGVGQLGLGIFNALEQKKVNDFMQGYYSDQMDLQKTDFANSARSTNEALESRQRSRLMANGVSSGTDEMTNRLNAYMDKNRVDETI